MAVHNPRAPTFLEHEGWKFLIIDSPTNESLPTVLRLLQEHGVNHLVRVCDPTYNTNALEKAGIEIHDWPFTDGDPPPDKVVQQWLSLVYDSFVKKRSKETIAVHCVAGLGRAPVLVAVALIEHGMHALDAVRYIRERRRGAINRQQVDFLEKYKPHKSCTLL